MVTIKYFLLTLVFCIASFAQSTSSSPVANKSCVGAPGATTGAFLTTCQTGAGILFTCFNASGCTAVTDWVTQSVAAAAITASITNINTTETNVSQKLVQGGTVTAGTMYRVFLWGTCTITSSTSATSHFNVYMGPAGNNTDTLIGAGSTTSVVSSATNIASNPFEVQLDIIFRSTTSAIVEMKLATQGNAGIFTAANSLSGPVGPTTVATGSNFFITVTYVTTGTTVTSSFQVTNIQIANP